MTPLIKTWLTASLVASASLAFSSAANAASHEQDDCTAFAARARHFSEAGVRLTGTTFVPQSAPASAQMGPDATAPVPVAAHCDLTGVMHERTGQNGQAYAVRFHMRLPVNWNQRFVFQGGGGSNGDIGDALGTGAGAIPAISLGYAVVSQDSGHDNATNTDPAHNGRVAFGFDPTARADYGHTSLKAVADAAKAIITAYYGRPPSVATSSAVRRAARKA